MSQKFLLISPSLQVYTKASQTNDPISFALPFLIKSILDNKIGISVT